jgi:hypothetical protein
LIHLGHPSWCCGLFSPVAACWFKVEREEDILQKEKQSAISWNESSFVLWPCAHNSGKTPDENKNPFALLLVTFDWKILMLSTFVCVKLC